MNLSEALQIERGDVVVFVGAGGKTTAMFRVAHELAARGLRVVSTTTTRIGQDELQIARNYLLVGQPPALPNDFPSLLARYRHLFVFSEKAPPNKARGVPPEWVDAQLAGNSAVDVVLVEADGSRRLPLKAPQPHEPAMPQSATLVVPIAGLSALGEPLDEAHVYGSEDIAARAGLTVGATITPEVIAAVLGGDDMGLKDVPPGARIVPLMNQVTDATLPEARRIAQSLLARPAIRRVVAAAAGEEEAVREVYRRVVGVVLAAGQSIRMGQAKLLLPWGEGSTMIREVCRAVLASGLQEVIVVTGAWREQVEEALAGLPVTLVHNPDYAEGEMLSSVKVGLRAAPADAEAALVFLGDQPGLEPGVVGAVLHAYAGGRGRIIAPAYQGRRGHPVLFDRATWEMVMALPTGTAPRALLSARPEDVVELEVDTPSILQDIDTPDDYEQARRSGA
ncbi:MAG TPA: selenium cofactor biosynthesis protein YqeC [Aggregatilineales bacterium]|nr:selenium cofactor biosynthesis protein YqeC [Aggregatilineales bacterium]